MFNIFGLLEIVGLPLLIFALVALIVLIFEIWMFVDILLNKNLDNGRKALWIIGMLLIHPFVAIAYYFTDHQKRT